MREFYAVVATLVIVFSFFAFLAKIWTSH